MEGKLRTRSWDDQNGNTRYTTEIVGDQMTMLGGRGDAQQQAAPQAAAATAQPAAQPAATPEPASAQPLPAASPDDDLPF